MTFAANDHQPSRSRAPAAQGLLPEAHRSTLLTTIARVRDVVERETRMLRSREPIELSVFNLQKRQGLLELTRQLRSLPGTIPDPEICNRLGDLRVDLEKNSAALQLHLKAVQEISAIVSRSIQDAESDGTYSMGMNLRNRYL